MKARCTISTVWVLDAVEPAWLKADANPAARLETYGSGRRSLAFVHIHAKQQTYARDHVHLLQTGCGCAGRMLYCLDSRFFHQGSGLECAYRIIASFSAIRLRCPTCHLWLPRAFYVSISMRTPRACCWLYQVKSLGSPSWGHIWPFTKA
eukprot:2224261-Amphidinium_carterae.1